MAGARFSVTVVGDPSKRLPARFYNHLIQFSDHYIGKYSAQQAILDHRSEKEAVEISVEIPLTPTYGAFIPSSSGAQSGSPPVYTRDPLTSGNTFESRLTFPADAPSDSVTIRVIPPEGPEVSVDFDLVSLR